MMSTFWRQAVALTEANLKSRYRKTLAGFVWVVLNPLILYGAQAIAFHHILRINMENYPLFLLSGLLPWSFLVSSLDMSVSSFVTHGRMLKAYPVDPLVFMVAQLLDNAINFVAAFLSILLVICLFMPANVLGVLLVPFAVIPLVGATLGMALIFATAQVFFRDTAFILRFLLNVSFFLTPIFYPAEFVPEAVRWIVQINPFYHLLMPFRSAIHQFSPQLFASSFGVALLVAMALLGAGATLWYRKRNEIYLYI